MWKRFLHQDQHIQSIEKLYSQKENMAYHIAYEILQDREEAENVVQRVLWFAAGNIDNLPDTEPALNAYLAKLVKKKALSRKFRLQKHHPLEAGNRRHSSTIIAPDSPAAQALHQYMTKLDTRSREVIYRRYIYGMSCEEIARRMELTPAAARRILSEMEIALSGCEQSAK